jgi:fructosamine-3-kinase
VFNDLAGELNPAHKEIFGDFKADYYWSVQQSEWATDINFRRRAELRRLYPRLVHHGMTSFGSGDVLRFLGRKLSRKGKINPSSRPK